MKKRFVAIEFFVLAVFTLPSFAQISMPQIPLTGNIGCAGFPCVNNGTLIMPVDADYYLTAQDTSVFYINVTSAVALTGTRNLFAPTGNFPFTIENSTIGGQSLQIIGPSGSGVTIANGATVSVWNDGTNYVQSGSGAYLPLSGGTLTGPISFSSNSAANTTMTNLGMTQTGAIGTSSQVDTLSGNLNVTGTVAAGTTATPTYPQATNQLVGKQYADSRYGRASAASMPQLFAAMANYNFTTRPPIYIASFGSSVSVGATLPNAALQAPCGHFVYDLQARFPGPGGLTYNFQCANMSVNGATVKQFPAAWIEYTTYALSGVTINTPGTGYAVGDWETVNQGPNTQGGAVIVTAVSSGGVPTAIAISPYPGTITLTDTSTPSTSLYSVASNVPTLNGAPPNTSVGEQTGTGTGLTVNITSVGLPTPAAVLFAYGMNERGPLQYNAGETLQGGLRQQGAAIQTVQAAGADSVVTTTTHESVVWEGSASWAWNTSIQCALADFMTTCIPSATPNYSVVDPTTSVTTGDLANLGTPITVDSRLIQVNTGFRAKASQYHSALIDAEKYWFEALETETAAQGSQLAAEQVLFSVAGPHPDLLGHQLSYWKAIDDFTAALGTQTAQPTATGDFPFSPDAQTTVNRQVFTIAYTSSPATFTVPAMTSGAIKITSRPQFQAKPQTVGVFGFSSDSANVRVGPDTGTNSYAVYPTFTLTASGLTVTLTPNFGTTQYAVEIDSLATAGLLETSEPNAAGVNSPFALQSVTNKGSSNTFVRNAISQPAPFWVLLGTWTAADVDDSLRVQFDTSAGNFGVGKNTQTHSVLTVNEGDDFAPAPDLNGLSVFVSGGQPFVAIKAYAHGGSTAINNRVWDIYVEMNTYSGGIYSVSTSPAAAWSNSGTISSDPGPASTTVAVGIIANPSVVPSFTTISTFGTGLGQGTGCQTVGYYGESLIDQSTGAAFYRVHLRGCIVPTGPALASGTLFSLPAAYCPISTTTFPGQSYASSPVAGAEYITIRAASGGSCTVTFNASPSTYSTGVDGIIYETR